MTVIEYNKDGKTFRDSLASVPVLAPEWRARAVTRLNSLTKPLGSLGRLEEIAARLAAIREEDRPRCTKKVIFTLAADHGVTPEAVLRADIVEEAYGGPVEIVQTGNGRVPIVLPVSRLRDRVKEQ